LQEESVCTGTCDFNYSSSLNVSVNTPDSVPILAVGDTFTITGSGFSNSDNTATLKLSDNSSISGTVVNNTINFTVP